MAEVGSAYVSILPSARGFGTKLQAQVGSDVTKAGKESGRKFGAAFKVGATVAAVAVGGFLKSAVDNASDFSESASKVGVVFGKSSDQIIKASKTSATAMGLSKNAYLEATGTLGNLLVSLDIAPDKAAGLSQEMVKLAGDLASFNNTSPEEALDALRAGLTGETEPLKKFGVNMNEATLKAQAMKMGLIKSTKDALNPQAKALAAQALIMAQTTTAQGDFARTSGGLANQQRILSAQFTNLKTTIGAALLPVVTQFITFLTSTVVPKVRQFIQEFKNGEGLGGRFAAVLQRIGAVLATVATFVDENRTAVGAFVGIIASAVVVAKAFAAAQALVNLVLTANPIGIVVVAIAALVAGIIYAYKNSEKFRAVLDKLWAGIKVGVATAIAVFTGLADLVSSIFTGLGDKLFNAGKELIGRLIDGIKAMLGPIGDAIGAVADVVGKFWPGSPIKRGPLKSWNNGGAGKRLVGFLADGLAQTRPVETAMDKLSSKVSLATGRIGTPQLAMAGAGGQQVRGTLSIDRDGVAYIHGVSRREIRSSDATRQAADRAAALGGADFR